MSESELVTDASRDPVSQEHNLGSGSEVRAVAMGAGSHPEPGDGVGGPGRDRGSVLSSRDHSSTYAVGFFLLAVLGIGLVCLRVLLPFLAALAWAAILAVAFQRPWGFLHRLMPARRGLAAALLTVAIAVGVLVPAGLLLGLLTHQVRDVAAQIATSLSAEHVKSSSDLVALPKVAHALHQVRTWAGLSPGDFESLSAEGMRRISSAAGSLSGKVALWLFDTVMTLVLVIFLLFFMLRDGQELATATVELLPVDRDSRSRLGQSIEEMLTAIFRGSLLCALAQGLLGACGWWIAGLPSPALAGLAMAILSLLPVGGTALVWMPGAVWAWLTGHHGAGIFLFGWGLVVTVLFVDTVLRPLLVKGADELTTPIVFFGVFGGLAAFGLLGVFIGPVALATAVALLQVMRGQSGDQRSHAVAGDADGGGTGPRAPVLGA